jgi:hypothetical protein
MQMSESLIRDANLAMPYRKIGENFSFYGKAF